MSSECQKIVDVSGRKHTRTDCTLLISDIHGPGTGPKPNPVPDPDVQEAFYELDRQVGMIVESGRAPDPWKHRSVGMRCKTCMFFVPKVPSAGPKPPDTQSFDLGRCRRHAPTMGGFPAVFVNDWCGDHKLDENKL
jgi:hypothetical protein